MKRHWSDTHSLALPLALLPLALIGSWLLVSGCSGADPDEDGWPLGAQSDVGTGGMTDEGDPTTSGGSHDGGNADGTGDDTGGVSGPDLTPEPPPDSDAHDKLFSHDYLPVYRITMEGTNWLEAWDYLLAQLDPKDKCALRPFSEAHVTFENPWTDEVEDYDEVGFRIRGHDLPKMILAQPNQRFGFKMSFVEYTPGRRFHGHRRLNFLSSERDDSLMKQCLTYELMRDFDVPAARCNFAAVYVNDDYVGVFAHVEERDDGSYVENRFPDDPAGSLYEFGDCWGDEDDVLMDLGPDVEPYVDTYQLEAGTLDTDMLTDLIPFSQCASAPDETFTGCIENHLDLQEWHRAMASILSIPEMDGWAASSSNFLLYNYGPLGAPRRFVIFPWDVDRSFKDDCFENDGEGGNHKGACHILGTAWEDGSSPELVNRLREPPFRADFCAAVQSFVDFYYNPTAMEARLDDLRTRPRHAVYPFAGIIDPSLDDLMHNDPLWEYQRYIDEVNAIVGKKVFDRYNALQQQLLECEVSPLVVN